MKLKTTFLLGLALVGSIFLIACKDNTPPVIELAGGTSIMHVLNTEFVEPGYDAYDDKDDSISVSVTDFDVNTVGMYEITYSAQDAEGNMYETNRKISVYNEAKGYYASYWQGDYVFPYPGAAHVAYVDSVKAAPTVNMDIIFVNFAGSGAEVTGSVIREGVLNAPLVRFADQTVGGKAFTAKDALIRSGTITVEYTLGTDNGIVILEKQ